MNSTLRKLLYIIFLFNLIIIGKAQINKNLKIDFSKKTTKEIFDLMEVYTLNIENHLNQAENYYNRARLKYYLGDTLNSINDAKQASEINPKNSEYHFQYAFELYDLKKYEIVIKECEIVLGLTPNNPSAMVLIGDALDEIGEREKSKVYFRKSIVVSPDYDDAYTQYATSFFFERNFNKTDSILDVLLSRKPHSVRGLRFKAKSQFAQKKYDSVLLIADRLIAIKESEGEGYLFKSLSYDSLKNKAKACECMLNSTLYGYSEGYDYIMKYCPREQENKTIKHHTLTKEGIELDAIGDYTKALNSFDQAIIFLPDSGISYYNRGKTKRKMENHSGAIEDYKIAISKSPHFADAYLAMGVSYTFSGNIEKAKEFYLKTIKVNPLDAKAYYNFADLLRVNENNCKESIYYYKYAINLKPDYLKAYFYLGNCYEELNMNKEACEAYTQAEKLGEIKAMSKRIWLCK